MDINIEPVNAIPIQSTSMNKDIPERLQNILNALSDYHHFLLQKYSLESQNPNALQGLELILEDRAKLIKYFLLHGKWPEGIQIDSKLQDCLSILQTNSTPWDPKISTLARHWCSIMFEKYPFTANHNHIVQLLNNSLAEVENDGPEYNTEDEES